MRAIGDYSDFPYFAGAAALIAPALLWSFLVEKKKRITIYRGVVVGLLAAVAAHCLTWYLMIFEANIEYWVLGRQIGSLPGPPLDPVIGAVLGSVLYGGISLFLYGWVTMPIGALLGGMYGKLFMKAITCEDAMAKRNGDST